MGYSAVCVVRGATSVSLDVHCPAVGPAACAPVRSAQRSPPPPPKKNNWGVHLDAPGQRRGAVALLRSDPTRSSETGTDRGLRWHNLPRERKGVCAVVRIGQAGGARARGGERPLGADASGGKGFKQRTRGSGERPTGAAAADRDTTRRHAPPPPPKRRARERGEASRQAPVCMGHGWTGANGRVRADPDSPGDIRWPARANSRQHSALVWVALRCSKGKTMHRGSCGDDHMPVTRGYTRALYPLLYGPNRDHEGNVHGPRGGCFLGHDAPPHSPRLIHRGMRPRQCARRERMGLRRRVLRPVRTGPPQANPVEQSRPVGPVMRSPCSHSRPPSHFRFVRLRLRRSPLAAEAHCLQDHRRSRGPAKPPPPPPPPPLFQYIPCLVPPGSSPPNPDACVTPKGLFPRPLGPNPRRPRPSQWLSASRTCRT